MKKLLLLIVMLFTINGYTQYMKSTRQCSFKGEVSDRCDYEAKEHVAIELHLIDMEVFLEYQHRIDKYKITNIFDRDGNLMIEMSTPKTNIAICWIKIHKNGNFDFMYPDLIIKCYK